MSNFLWFYEGAYTGGELFKIVEKQRNPCGSGTHYNLCHEGKPTLLSLLTNDMESDLSEIIDIYRERWEIELLFKQMKQNFPLKYFYGESANVIKIQI